MSPPYYDIMYMLLGFYFPVLPHRQRAIRDFFTCSKVILSSLVAQNSPHVKNDTYCIFPLNYLKASYYVSIY